MSTERNMIIGGIPVVIMGLDDETTAAFAEGFVEYANEEFGAENVELLDDDASEALAEALAQEPEPIAEDDPWGDIDKTLPANHPLRIMQETEVAEDKARAVWRETGLEPDRIALCEAGEAHYKAYMAAQDGLKAGDTFTVAGLRSDRYGAHNPWPGFPREWEDGQSLTGTYTFLGRFKARRSDGVEVKMPQKWRLALDWYRDAAVPEDLA